MAGSPVSPRNGSVNRWMRSWAVAADQLDVAAVDDRQQPVPVMLDLVQPALALRRRRAGRNDLERNALKQVSRNRVGGKRKCRHGISGGNIGARGRCYRTG